MFQYQTPHAVLRADGRRVRVSVPASFPPRLVANGVLYRFERQGYRVGDGRPAGYYTADDGTDLWLCQGRGYAAE